MHDNDVVEFFAGTGLLFMSGTFGTLLFDSHDIIHGVLMVVLFILGAGHILSATEATRDPD